MVMHCNKDVGFKGKNTLNFRVRHFTNFSHLSAVKRYLSLFDM